MAAAASYSNLALVQPRPVRLSVVEKKALISAEREAEVLVKRKVEQAHNVLTRLEARASSLDAQIALLTKRKKATEARAVRIEDRILDEMNEANITSVAGIRTTFTSRPCPMALVVDNVKLIPAKYMRTPKPAAAAPDKNEIKKVLDAADSPDATPEQIAEAAAIEGVHLSQKHTLLRS